MQQKIVLKHHICITCCHIQFLFTLKLKKETSRKRHFRVQIKEIPLLHDTDATTLPSSGQADKNRDDAYSAVWRFSWRRWKQNWNFRHDIHSVHLSWLFFSDCKITGNKKKIKQLYCILCSSLISAFKTFTGVYRYMFDFHVSFSKRRVRELQLISYRVRGGDITGEESESSADERVFTPWRALRELKRGKLYSVFDANLPAAACQPACLSVSAELMLVFRGCCWATWQVSRRGTPPRERTCPMGKTQVRLRSKYGVKFDSSVCAILVLVQP